MARVSCVPAGLGTGKFGWALAKRGQPPECRREWEEKETAPTTCSSAMVNVG